MPLASPPTVDTAWPDLAEEHLALVDEALRRLQRRLPSHVDRDDLAGAGRVALVQAARQYDPDLGPFPPFAVRRLSGAMLDELRREDWATRSVRREGRRRRAGVEELSARLGRTPSREEVAEAVGVSAAALSRHEADTLQAVITSLEVLLEAGGEPVGEDAAPVDAVLAVERSAQLHEAITTLPPRTRHAVRGRYLDERPLRDLAVELGVTESRVSQLCSEGVAALRAALSRYLDGVPEPREGGRTADARR